VSDWSNYIWFSIVGAALMLSVLVVWFSAAIPGMDRWNRRFFRSYFIVFILCCISCLTGIALYYYHAPEAVAFSVVILECLLLSLPLPMLTVYLLHYCGENMRSGRILKAVIALWFVYFFILASSLFIEGFLYAMPDGQYYRGPLYPLLPLPLIAILLINLTGTIHHRKRLDRKVFLSFLFAMVPTTIAMIMQLFVDVTLFIDISYVFSGLAMYRFVLADQIEQDLSRQREIADQQREIARQRASIMVLQMRPHFIYNTLSSIYCLCSQDPEKAQQVVMDFTTYLRKNFAGIASAAPIPFTSELEHTRAYLEVEQAQYAKSLFVNYDTPHTLFRIPPLTLQPIVENAVKHGRNPDSGPLHISIRTRKTDNGSEITVSDDGRGFDPDINGDPGIALDNIRQRLEMMCGGSLAITPRDGGGTIVKITIPDNATQ
jgi:signal transduction histidine kinase